jgi:hypothetical protein
VNKRILVVAMMLGGVAMPLAAGTNGSSSGGNAALATRVSAYVASLNTATTTMVMTPSFARQTGLACSACHTHYPELTATGRAFKLNGYVLRRGAGDSIQGQSAGGDQNMLLGLVAPLSFMVQTSFTQTKTDQPGTQNGTIFLPDELSVFTGGEISPHMGGFLQLTFDPQSGSMEVDNADFRYANNTTLFGQHTVFGVSLNNNPTVQDLWNSTPAWGFPYGSSAAAPAPAASALIDGQLGGQVAGLTAYTMLGDHLYAELGAYRSAPLGVERPTAIADAAGRVQGFAPYWRVALPFNLGDQYLSIGTYGMVTKLYSPGIVGEPDKFTDMAFDVSYLLPSGSNSLTVDGTWIHETQHRPTGSATNTDNTLNTLRAAAMYHLDHSWAFTVAPFTTTGTSDVLLYQPAELTGSATNSPNSTGLIGEVDVMPWQNVRFQFQYVAYSKFNGGSTNYDGSGRNASDNNTLYALLWLLF